MWSTFGSIIYLEELQTINSEHTNLYGSILDVLLIYLYDFLFLFQALEERKLTIWN